MKIKHIYWFSYFNLDEPSVRYRAKYPLQRLLAEHNFTYDIVYPGYDFHNFINFLLTFFRVLFFRKNNSIIVFQKIFTTGIYATALKVLLYFRPRNTLYDIDDAEYTRRPAQTMHHFMKNCSACSAGSQALMEYIGQYNSQVLLLTSPIMQHDITKTKRESILTLGWIGYYGAHRHSLTGLFFPGLLEIDFPLRLVLLGVANIQERQDIESYFKENKNIKIDTPFDLDWHNEESIYRLISTFDIGVAPLTDDEFNRAKSAFKLKQCLSCGVPVLASRVGENNVFLQDGLNGFFCDEPKDYFQKIKQINDMDEREYHQLSVCAKSSLPIFSIEHYCNEFINFFGFK